MRIEISASGQRHCLCFYRDGGELFFTDTINIHDHRQRQRLIANLVDLHHIDRAEAEEKMLEIVQENVNSEPDVDRCPYAVQDGRIIHVASGSVLANFTAEIVEELHCDDGVEQCRLFVIEGILADGTQLPETRVAAAEFDCMDWVTRVWGSRAIIAAGRATRDQLRAAIQEFSRDAHQRTLFRHTGWRRVGNDNVYLHAGGAIGAEGTVPEIDVDLPPALEHFKLPEPPTGEACREAVLASLDFLDVGPDHITVPLLAAAYRAVLGGTDFSLHLVGPSGAFKSSVTALAQQHFGPRMDATHLPCSWSSTANSLEGIAFAAKDSLLAVDDFAPAGNTNQAQAAHRDADRLIRAQGNHSGRQRMRADGTVRPTKPPRGLIISTGEDVPRGHSIAARMLIVKLSPGDIVLDRLNDSQCAASEGHYAASMAGFLRWLAPQFDEIQEELREDYPRLRESMRLEGVHPRTPGIAAHLFAGIRCFLNFAVDAECLTRSEADALEQRCLNALREAISEQRDTQATTAPEQQFLTLIASVLATGKGHLVPVGNRRPEYIRHYGWHPDSSAHYGYGLVPRGDMIGYVHDDNIYLNPEAAFAAAQRLAREGGEAIPIGQRTLVQRLYEAGMLITEDSQETHLHRLMVDGSRIRALRLRSGALAIQEVATVENTSNEVSTVRETTNRRCRIRPVRNADTRSV